MDVPSLSFRGEEHQLPNVTVFLGRHAQGSANPNEVGRKIARVIRHPRFGELAYMDSDIVLLRLSSPVAFTAYVRPVCLAAAGSTLHGGSESWVTGWGAILEDGVLSEY